MTNGVRRRMPVEQRREQLIAVALDLFGSRSPDDVSMDDVAAAAGISRPLVYHYFPGKQSLYEAALRRAARQLADLLAEPREGPLGPRLLRVLHRFFDFVEQHGPGFSALMRSGPAAADSEACAVVGEVRRAAYEEVLGHLGVVSAPPRLELAVRSWISLTETTALLWLDDRHIPRGELEAQLVRTFAAITAVSASYCPEMTDVLRDVLVGEPEDSPFFELAAGLGMLVAQPG
ncbi:TetR/AcrR family transcriptional regulator [Streptomyces gamaensis]|uniref:TetR/AcrR family transcriptional regulator n=1 Tax=Streptomyces gamaensis TaxID=1763542 RepID=UPI003AA8ACFC